MHIGVLVYDLLHLNLFLNVKNLKRLQKGSRLRKSLLLLFSIINEYFKRHISDTALRVR